MTLSSLKNKGFHLSSDPVEADQKYTIPSEEECATLLPTGVWVMMKLLAENTLRNFSKVTRFMSIKAKMPGKQQPATSTVMFIDSKTMLEFSFLPRGYEIIKPHARLPRSHCVVLPEVHHVIIHSNLSVPTQHTVLTWLLCIDEPNSTPNLECLYVIFIAQNDDAYFIYMDGAKVETKDNKLVITKFFEEKLSTEMIRYDLSGLQQLLDRALPNRYFENINILPYLVKYRRYVCYCTVHYCTKVE